MTPEAAKNAEQTGLDLIDILLGSDDECLDVIDVLLG